MSKLSQLKALVITPLSFFDQITIGILVVMVALYIAYVNFLRKHAHVPPMARLYKLHSKLVFVYIALVLLVIYAAIYHE